MTTSLDSATAQAGIAWLWPALVSNLVVAVLFRIRSKSFGLTPFLALLVALVIFANVFGLQSRTEVGALGIGSLSMWPAAFAGMTLVYLYRDPRDLRATIVSFFVANVTLTLVALWLWGAHQGRAEAYSGLSQSHVLAGVVGFVSTLASLLVFVMAYESLQLDSIVKSSVRLYLAYAVALALAVVVDTLLYSGACFLVDGALASATDTSPSVGRSISDLIVSGELWRSAGVKLISAALCCLFWGYFYFFKGESYNVTVLTNTSLRHTLELARYVATERDAREVDLHFCLDRRSSMNGHRYTESYMSREINGAIGGGMVQLALLAPCATDQGRREDRHDASPRLGSFLDPVHRGLAETVGRAIRSQIDDQNVKFGTLGQQCAIIMSGATEGARDEFLLQVANRLRTESVDGGANAQPRVAIFRAAQGNLTSAEALLTLARRSASTIVELSSRDETAAEEVLPQTIAGLPTVRAVQWILADLPARGRQMMALLERRGLEFANELLRQMEASPGSISRSQFRRLASELFGHFEHDPEATRRLDETFERIEHLWESERLDGAASKQEMPSQEFTDTLRNLARVLEDFDRRNR